MTEAPVPLGRSGGDVSDFYVELEVGGVIGLYGAEGTLTSWMLVTGAENRLDALVKGAEQARMVIPEGMEVIRLEICDNPPERWLESQRRQS